MVSKKMTELQPWECLMKRIVWKQLGDIRDKKILDFGSGIGVTANYNERVAITAYTYISASYLRYAFNQRVIKKQ